MIGYVYGRVSVGQTGGLLQLWLLRRFGTLCSLQPILFGLILLTRQFWTLGGVLVGVGVLVIVLVELFADWKMRLPGLKSLTTETRKALDEFKRMATHTTPTVEGNGDEAASLVGTRRRTRSRGSMASVLEMMSVTLAVMPSSRSRGPVPLGKTVYIFPVNRQ